MKFHDWVQARTGLDPDELRDNQLAKLQAKYDAEPDDIHANAPAFSLSAVMQAHDKHVDTLQARAAAYTDKINNSTLETIQAAAVKTATDLKVEAVEGGKSDLWLETKYTKALDDYEVKLIRAEMPTAPAIYGRKREMDSKVMEAAFCRTAGMPNIEKQYKPEVLEAADKLQGFGLQELLLHGAIQGGYTGRMYIGRSTCKEILQAAFSTHTVTTMLTQLGHKNLLAGFESIQQTWKEVASTGSVPDFKQMTAFRLTADLEYEELGPGGEIHHGELGQEAYTNQAKTYAKMAALTRTDIINDDLGAFNDLRKRLGMGCALKVNKEFWTAWLTAANGAEFWTEERGNYISGGTTVLAEAGLNEALVKFRSLSGPDGNAMNLIPDRILVPPELEATAKILYVSTETRNTTASTKSPTANIYFDRFRPLVVPELSSSSYTGYSTTHWWLLPDPAILASAAVVFLDGVQTPVIESADADFNTLGISFRGYHDFGVAMSEWRSSVYSAGA